MIKFGAGTGNVLAWGEEKIYCAEREKKKNILRKIKWLIREKMQSRSGKMEQKDELRKRH